MNQLLLTGLLLSVPPCFLLFYGVLPFWLRRREEKRQQNRYLAWFARTEGDRKDHGKKEGEARKDPRDPSPREEHLSWDEYFMGIAFLSAKRSKDPKKQVGACIVDSDKVIRGIGYNGFPRGCSDNVLPWAREGESTLDTKFPYVVHAEANAILNKNSASIKGARIFVTTFPCNECAKLIIQSGITEVIYHEDKLPAYTTDREKAEKYEASRKMLKMAGVAYRQFVPGLTVVLDM